ncbi:MAG: PPC domain-containing protein, partial [Yoonia sp.]
MKLPMTCIAALCAASPALSQGVCAGAVSDGQWIGGTQSASDVTTADTHREQLALILGDNAYVGLFSLSDSTPVRIEAAGRGAGDPLIEVFDSTGSIIGSDDDSGGNNAARIEQELAAGDYCVKMTSYEGAPLSAFLRIGRQDQEPLTPGMASANTTPAEAGNCANALPFGALGGTQTGAVDDNGFWSFTLTEPTALTITADNADADPTISLLDADATEIAENDDHDGLNARIDVTSPLEAGDYCLAVGAVNDTSLPIDITISVYDPAAALVELINKGEVAPKLDGTTPVTDLGVLQTTQRHDLQTSGDVQWFTITMPQASLLLAEAIAPVDGDPWLVIFDALGRKVGFSDDTGESLNSTIPLRINAGTYIIGT